MFKEIYLIGFATTNVQDFIVLLLTSLKGSDITTFDDCITHSQNSSDLYPFFKG